MKTIRIENVTIRKCSLPGETTEYLVRIDGSPKSHGYFTDDLEDAKNTAAHMAKEDAARQARKLARQAKQPAKK